MLMRKLVKTSLLLGVFLLMLSFPTGVKANAFQISISHHGDDPKNGEVAAYELALEDQEGNKLDLKDLQGKVVFINFWATWCPPCIVEMPDIDALYGSLKDDDEIVFLMISLDQDFDKAKQFLIKKDFGFNVYKVDGSIPSDFQTRGIPTTFVLGKDGKIAEKYMGSRSYNNDDFKALLKGLKG